MQSISLHSLAHVICILALIQPFQNISWIPKKFQNSRVAVIQQSSRV